MDFDFSGSEVCNQGPSFSSKSNIIVNPSGMSFSLLTMDFATVATSLSLRPVIIGPLLSIPIPIGPCPSNETQLFSKWTSRDIH